MGLMNKLKNILFEEEEVEIPVIDKKSKKSEERVPAYKEAPRKEEVKEQNYTDFFESLEPTITDEPKKEEPLKVADVAPNSTISDREMFNHERTFNFPAFDEEEFENMTPKPRHTNTNVLDYEKKKSEKKQEYKKEEVKKVEDKAKFRPSPIISPVYGILDKNYTPDEITSRDTSANSRVLDVDSVRKKAFGVMEEVKEPNVVEEEKIETEDKILEEKLEKARTIDELLKDSSDDVIDVSDEDIEKPKETDNLENIEPKHEENLEDDTLESDLFDLIDSMYENREDGE